METNEQVQDSMVQEIPATETENQTENQDQQSELQYYKDQVEFLAKSLLELKETMLTIVQSQESQPPAATSQSNVRSNNKYVLLKKELPSWGKVPRQQADIADIIARNFNLNEPFTDEELDNVLTESAPEYDSLANSVQTPMRLFRYYRGLKREKNHAGYVAREFLRVA